MNLVTVQGSMRLDGPAAAAWFALEAAGIERFRWNANITNPAGAHRPPEMVLDMWFSSPARRKAVYGVPLGGSVARPKSLGGPGSVHENGRCVDIGNWYTILPGDEVGADLRLQRLAKEFGFIRTIKGERWHYEYKGSGGGAGGGDEVTAQENWDYGVTSADPAAKGAKYPAWRYLAGIGYKVDQLIAAIKGLSSPAAPVIDDAAAALIASKVKVPSKEDIAAEVIRQQKLPGN